MLEKGGYMGSERVMGLRSIKEGWPLSRWEAGLQRALRGLLGFPGGESLPSGKFINSE